MKRILVALSLLIVLVAGPAQADSILFDNTPSPQPGNLPSLGYQATSTQEFGALISFGAGQFDLTSFTVLMSNWAYETQYEAVGTSAGFNVPMTLSLYQVGAGNTVGPLLDAVTLSAFIPWRPEPDPVNCAPGSNNNYKAADGNCYAGSLSSVTFNLGGFTAPGDVIFGLAYNTQTHGYSPTGVSGPVNSLNFALSSTAPSVGAYPLPGSVFWNTSFAGFYADGGAGGVGTFRQDTGWDPYSPAVTVVGAPVPEPASLLLLGTGLLGVVRLRRRKVS